MGAVPGPDLLRPQRGENVNVESGIQFPSLSLFLLGLSSFETATLKTFRAVSRVGPVTPRLSRG